MSLKLRPEVQAFAELMETRLRKHDEKRGQSWKQDGPLALFNHLKEEVEELNAEIKWDGASNPQKTGNEAADVANMAMMIADVSGALKTIEMRYASVEVASFSVQKPSVQKPSVGRTVHFHTDTTPLCAFIAEVHTDEEVTLFVLDPFLRSDRSYSFYRRAKYSADPVPGCWGWPPRV